MVPTKPPCPTTTSGKYFASRTSTSTPSDISATPQPTSDTSIPTKPATTATGPKSTESLSVESTPVNVVTDHSTTMAVIVAVVLVVLVVILAVLLLVIVAVVQLSKGRNKKFADTQSSLHMGITNKVYGM